MPANHLRDSFEFIPFEVHFYLVPYVTVSRNLPIKIHLQFVPFEIHFTCLPLILRYSFKFIPFEINFYLTFTTIRRCFKEFHF